MVIVQGARLAPGPQHLRRRRPVTAFRLADHRPVETQMIRQRLLRAEPGGHPRACQLLTQERTRVGFRVTAAGAGHAAALQTIGAVSGIASCRSADSVTGLASWVARSHAPPARPGHSARTACRTREEHPPMTTVTPGQALRVQTPAHPL